MARSSPSRQHDKYIEIGLLAVTDARTGRTASAASGNPTTPKQWSQIMAAARARVSEEGEVTWETAGLEQRTRIQLNRGNAYAVGNIRWSHYEGSPVNADFGWDPQIPQTFHYMVEASGSQKLDADLHVKVTFQNLATGETWYPDLGPLGDETGCMHGEHLHRRSWHQAGGNNYLINLDTNRNTNFGAYKYLPAKDPGVGTVYLPRYGHRGNQK